MNEFSFYHIVNKNAEKNRAKNELLRRMKKTNRILSYISMGMSVFMILLCVIKIAA